MITLATNYVSSSSAWDSAILPWQVPLGRGGPPQFRTLVDGQETVVNIEAGFRIRLRSLRQTQPIKDLGRSGCFHLAIDPRCSRLEQQSERIQLCSADADMDERVLLGYFLAPKCDSDYDVVAIRGELIEVHCATVNNRFVAAFIARLQKGGCIAVGKRGLRSPFMDIYAAEEAPVCLSKAEFEDVYLNN